MMKNLNFRLIIAVVIMFFFISSCDDDGYADYDAGGTAVEDMAGEWWVTFTIDGVDVYNIGYNLVYTYNTAANSSTEMWIDDLQNTWAFKVKSTVDLESKTFEGTGLENMDGDDITVNITGGKILYDVATSRTGVVTDSIYFDAEFSDDPGVIYTLSGHRRTGFEEDEY